MPTDALAHILTERQFLPSQEVERYTLEAAEKGVFLEEHLIQSGVFNARQLLQILENHYFTPSVDLEDHPYQAQLAVMLPRKLAERHRALVIGDEGDAIRVAFADPENAPARDALASALQKKVLPQVALRHHLDQAIRMTYDALEAEFKSGGDGAPRSIHSKPKPIKSRIKIGELASLNEGDALEMVNIFIEAAARHEATDIHFQPQEKDMAVRFRLDGILHTVKRLPRETVNATLSRVKVMADLDIAEHRLPQDGRITYIVGGNIYDLRVSAMPSQFGEKIVLRLLAKDMELLNIDRLQMPRAVYEPFSDVLNNPQGFYLVTGPTGSGKTTTLYAALNALDRESLNIITLEDPIEYTLPGLTQVAIREDIGMTFAAGLRSVLRQDPDVVLVGEIRDLTTVEIACRAAMTGHKVFSTLHTNDACQAISRLLDMGTAPFLVAATLRGVLAQRLVRKNCPHCLESYEPTEAERAVLGYPKIETLQRGAGCERCSGTGYMGREAIFEYFRIEENAHRLILERASPYTIRHAAQSNGMALISEFAKRAAIEGRTTVAEIQRAILSEEGHEQICGNCQRAVSSDFSVCPYCQHVLRETCPGCGHMIDSNWEACPNCGRDIEREWRRVFCRHCLAPVDPSWESCAYCGGDLR